DYLRYSLAIAGGYSEGMQYWGPREELLTFVGVAAAGAGIACIAEWRHGLWRTGDGRGLVFLAALLAYILVAFKAGFVRHDIHIMIGWSSMAVAFALYAAGAPAVTRSRVARAAMLAVSVVTVAFAVDANLGQSRISFEALVSDNIGAGFLD